MGGTPMPRLATVIGMFLAAWTAAIFCSGCNAFVSQAQYDQLQKQIIPLQDENRKLKEQNNTLVADVVDKRKQIDSLIGLGTRRIELVTHATAVELGDSTGAYNADATSKVPNSVKVYLLPKDTEDSVVKAAGTLQIKLFDLNAPNGQNLIGQVDFAPEQMAKNWYSGFMSMTYHYSFVCPWKRPPTKGEVHIRVEFTDYLTGKHLTAEKTINVQMPTTQPAK
jgi:hypothetical protein